MLSNSRWTQSFLRISPVDPRQQVRKLCRRDRHCFTGSRRPDESSSFESFCKQARSLRIVPNDFYQIRTAPPEAKQMPPQWVMLQDLLHLQSQARKAAPHVGMARRDPDPDAARYQDHRRLRTSRTRPNASASTFSSTLTRVLPPSSISIRPRRLRGGIAAGASIDGTLSAAAGVS